MPDCIAYDLTRLFLGPTRATPRGIDRVELGYAKHFLSAWPGLALATLPTPAGARVVARDSAMRIVTAIEQRWGETADANADDLLAAFSRRLRDLDTADKPVRLQGRSPGFMSGLGRILRQTGCVIGPRAEDAVPKNAIYLNLGQLGIAWPGFVGWLDRRPDIAPVFMLHDVIPLEHPHFVPASSSYFHGQMIKVVATHAAGVITSTKAAGASIRRELDKHRSTELPVLMEPLPVSPAFLHRQDSAQELAQIPYFVVLGSVEPRKNHLLLLKVWRELVPLEGRAAPKLVIAGSRWNGHKPVTDLLRNSAHLRRHIVEVSGLPTPSLLRILANAKGLLMPSFSEGFGLPIIEAMALGTPVIASDIPAHREAGGTYARYCDPNDVAAWLDAIRGLANGGERKANGHKAQGGAMTWPLYLSRVEAFLEDVYARHGAGSAGTKPA